MELKEKIDRSRVPQHVAVIMDGNGRWAKQQGQDRIFGHEHGVDSVRDTIEAAAEIGVKYLTLYAFSTENWNRPKEEVDALMELMVHSIHNEIDTFTKNNIRLQVIGDIQSLPEKCQVELNKALETTKNNSHMTVVIALSYSSKWEIINAVKLIAQEVKSGKLQVEEINEQVISDHLTTKGIPDPELMIRTSGETRISNFLLWQIAYAELYFTPVLWPDFRKPDFFTAILDFQSRERRFGKISEQLTEASK